MVSSACCNLLFLLPKASQHAHQSLQGLRCFRTTLASITRPQHPAAATCSHPKCVPSLVDGSQHKQSSLKAEDRLNWGMHRL